MPRDPRNRPRTGFSFARFLIPHLCGYQGRAIYLDADMLVFDDISKLWDLPLVESDILCAEQPTDKGRIRQYSVLLLNCDRLPWRIDEIVEALDEGQYDYARLMYDFCVVDPGRVSASLPYEWNSLEFYEPGRTCLLHYTDMPTQPWVSYQNQNGEPWYRMLRAALGEGFISKQELYHEVEQGNVMPDLPQRMGISPHPDYARLARDFVPPFRRLVRS